MNAILCLIVLQFHESNGSDRVAALAQIRENMSYEYLRNLREKHAAWRLLTADQAAFIASFFYREFIEEKRRGISADVLTEHLEDELLQLRRDYSEEEFPRSAREYLELWTDSRHGWLRKYHYHDEWYYDLTASAQKAVTWLAGLRRQEFIGTESRLHTVFHLLEEIARDTDRDPQTRREWLLEKKAEIEAELAELEGVDEAVPRLTEIQLKERFLQAESTAEGILADFREVEENFRLLQRRIQEDIITWTQGKGGLLDRIFEESDAIQSSEQGQSFQAFWNYLMLAKWQEDFRKCLDSLKEVESLKQTMAEHPLDSIHYDWVRAASAVQETIGGISAQLRRYVDEKYLREERYIYSLIQQIETKAMQVRERAPRGNFMFMDENAPEIRFPMDRRLFVPKKRTRRPDRELEQGRTEGADLEALLQQERIDPQRLRKNIDAMLEHQPEVSLREVLEQYPLQHGLMELLLYLVLAGQEREEAFQEEDWQAISFAHNGRSLQVEYEKIVYHRKG